MGRKCDYCVNKTQCKECKNTDKFIPSEEVRHYFQRSYVGVGGMDGYQYHWNSTNKNLVPTRHILISNTHYCPYCGELMYPIQRDISCMTIGYCCICQGAKTELEYKQKVDELKKKHENELYALQEEYRDKLTFCTNTLLEIKHRKEKEDMAFWNDKHNYFNTLDAKDIFI